jgi:hypothetical protein
MRSPLPPLPSSEAWKVPFEMRRLSLSAGSSAPLTPLEFRVPNRDAFATTQTSLTTHAAVATKRTAVHKYSDCGRVCFGPCAHQRLKPNPSQSQAKAASKLLIQAAMVGNKGRQAQCRGVHGSVLLRTTPAGCKASSDVLVPVVSMSLA